MTVDGVKNAAPYEVPTTKLYHTPPWASLFTFCPYNLHIFRWMFGQTDG